MNNLSKYYWQLPWAGPRIDGDRPGWAVMPDPALGNAMGVCVPATMEGNKLVLKPADPSLALPIAEARLGVWTTLSPQSAPDDGPCLCLLGYDQPEGGFGREYVVQGGDSVAYADLQAAVNELQRVRGDEVAAQLVRWPQDECRTNQPATVAEPSTAISLAIAFGCCQYQSGLMDGVPAEASYQRLADRLEQGDGSRPTHLLLLGDQVYVDATAGLLDPIRLDDRFRVPYEALLRIEPLRRVMRRIPVFSMLDDHEIADNWEPYRPGAAGSLHDHGVAAYWTFQRMRPPAALGPMPPIWYSVGGIGWAAFMANTRTKRDWRSETSLERAQILGQVQTEALEKWLLGLPPTHLKLIASPAMLLPRLVEHMDDPLQLDNWQGYPASLHGMLAFLCDNGLANVCFLSGDAHLGCDVSITVTGPTGNAVATRSIHAPALYSPLPFANEQPWNLQLSDRFTFDGPQGLYTCEVEGKIFLPHRDGCCLLQADRANASWKLTVEVI